MSDLGGAPDAEAAGAAGHACAPGTGGNGATGGTAGHGMGQAGGAGVEEAGMGGAAGSTGGSSSIGDLEPVGGCVHAMFGRYLQRTDDTLLFESEDGSVGQPPILDAATALPLHGVKSVADGTYHGCAALADKSVVCWRTNDAGNNAGQLGSGTLGGSGTLYRAAPVLVAAGEPLTDVVAMASGTSHSWGVSSCAITSDGSVYCWGDVAWLTNGGAAISAPYALRVTTDGVTPFTNVVQLSSGAYYSYCALTQSGSTKNVYCWGANLHGELGTGDMTAQPYPTKVLGLSAPTKVATFGWGESTCAVDDGKVRCWGSNAAGIGGPSATSTDVLTPTLVTLMGGTTALSGILDIYGGSADIQQGIGNNSVCALATDHTLKCWGSGFAGYPTTYGVTDVVAFGDLYSPGNPRALTSDGLYHYGSNVITPNCGAL